MQNQTHDADAEAVAKRGKFHSALIIASLGKISLGHVGRVNSIAGGGGYSNG